MFKFDTITRKFKWITISLIVVVNKYMCSHDTKLMSNDKLLLAFLIIVIVDVMFHNIFSQQIEVH